MTFEEELKLEEVRLRGRRQEKAWDFGARQVEASARATLEIGLAAAKSAILVNAGAVVALLAFVGQLWSRSTDELMAVVYAAEPLLWGLIFALTGIALAYFLQALFSARAQRDWYTYSQAPSDKVPFKWVDPWIAGVRTFLLGLGLLSYACFVSGVLDVVKQLSFLRIG